MLRYFASSGWACSYLAVAITKEMSNGTGISTITRRSMVAGLALSASAITLAGPNNAYAEAQTTPEKSLYERLGGVFAIAAVVDHFSDAVVKNPIVGQKSKNPQLREWHTKNLERLPGLKFMRTLWVCDVPGGPFKFTATKPGTTPLGLEEAHRNSGSPRQNLMRSQRSSDGHWTTSRSQRVRRPKSWQPSPLTKTRLPPATSKTLIEAKRRQLHCPFRHLMARSPGPKLGRRAERSVSSQAERFADSKRKMSCTRSSSVLCRAPFCTPRPRCGRSGGKAHRSPNCPYRLYGGTDRRRGRKAGLGQVEKQRGPRLCPADGWRPYDGEQSGVGIGEEIEC